MPDLFHFAKGLLDVQATDLAYGAKKVKTENGKETENSFRVTSSFQMAGAETAYSMLPGTILLQQQSGDSNKVNLIFKPKLSTSIKMPVKYIVYRGLQITSFLNGTNILTSQVLTTGSELIVEINKIQQSRGTDIISKKALFGYDLAPADAHNIDDFFYTNQADTVSQLFSISGGVELGNFAAVGANETNNEGAGIEIILENPDLKFTVEIAKRSSWKIDVAGMTDEAKKWTKEQIRHFVDPAAFYGLHSDIKGGIGYIDVGENETETKIQAKGALEVYNNIIDKFATKHNVYLDIRSENGYSYNCYDIYSNGNFRISINGGALQIAQYEWEDWPIYVIHALTNYVDKFKCFGFDIELQKASSTNNNPVILGRYAKKIAMQANYEVKNKKNIFLIDNLVFDTGQSYPTQFATVLVPSFNNDGINQYLSSIVRLDYIQKPDAGNTSLFSQKAPADFIFPAEVKIPWQGNAQIKWMNSYIDRCFYGEAQQGDGIDTVAVMQSGMAEEEIGNVKCFTYYAAPTVFFRSPKIIKDTYDFNFSGAAQSAPAVGEGDHIPKFNFLTFFDRKSSAGIQKEKIDGQSIFSYITTNEIKSGDAFLLGIAKSDIILLDKDKFSPYHHIFFKLEEDSTVNTYKLFFVGLDKDTMKEQVPSDNSVKVFSKDGKIFTSVAYQNAVGFEAQQGIVVHFRRTSDYKSDRFHFGFDWMRDGKYDAGSAEEPYIKAKTKTGLCEQANIDGTNINNRDEAQEYLKAEYNFEINRQTYYTPWLCMYEDHSEKVAALVNQPEKGQVILQLYPQYINKQKEEIVTFVPPEGIEIELSKHIEGNPLQTKVKDLKNVIVTVQCTGSSDQNRTIEVFDKNLILVGKLNIFKNRHIITRKVCFMNLTLIGNLPLKLVKTVEFKGDEISIAIIQDKDKNTTLQTSESKARWHSYLKNDKKNSYTKRFLHQALVKYEPENINDDGIIINNNFNLTINFPEGINGSLYVEINGIKIGDAVNSPIHSCIKTFLENIQDVSFEDVGGTNCPIVTFPNLNNDGFVSLLKKIQETNNTTVNEFFAQYTDFILLPGFFWKFTNENFVAFSNKSKFIVLCGIPGENNAETMAHEIAHNLKLLHSFKDDDDDNKKKFIFEKHKTENIMDYSNTEKSSSTAEKVSFWKWQWEYILDNND